MSLTTVASGTEIQFTDVDSYGWISGRVPAGGFTLTSTDFSGWFKESSMSANVAGRYRVYRYQPGGGGSVTELGGGPFDDGVEFGTAIGEMRWTGNVTDTAFSENDRILIRVFVCNQGTMGDGYTATFQLDGCDGTNYDSFFNIAETVAFKANSTTHSGTKTLAAAATKPFVGKKTATGSKTLAAAATKQYIGKLTAIGKKTLPASATALAYGRRYPASVRTRAKPCPARRGAR